MIDARSLEERIKEEFRLEIADGFKWEDGKTLEFNLSFLRCWLSLPGDSGNLDVNLTDDEGNLISIMFKGARDDNGWIADRIDEVYRRYLTLREENYWFSVCTITGEEEE